MSDWTEVARASTAQELENLVPAYAEIPAGTEVKILLELQWWAPIGKLADLAGAEWWAPRLVQADLDVIDVTGNWTFIEIYGRTRGTPLILIIAAIAAAVAILGLGVYLTSVVITANMEQKKLEQADKWIREGYTPEQVTRMLEATAFEPKTPEISIPGLPNIGTGMLIIGAVALFLILRK